MEKMTENTTGIVKSIRKDKKGVQLENGDWYSGFKALEVERGDEVEIFYVVNGQYKNIAQFKVLKTNKIAPQQFMQENKDKTTASMFVSYCKDLVVAGKIELAQMPQTAILLVEAYKTALKEFEK